MAEFWNPRPYQASAIRFGMWGLLEKRLIYGLNEGIGLLMEPGLGKTSTTLQICLNLAQLGRFKKALLIAPTRVCTSVWPKEAQRWSQFNRARFEVIAGLKSADRVAAFSRGADFYCINPEGTEWAINYLMSSGRINDFDTLIIDEVTKFKSPTSGRLKALAPAIGCFANRIILTGTPIPNSLQDIWGPVAILDNGKRLGENITTFRKRYCHPGGFRGHSFIGNKGAEEEVKEKIKDICLYLSAKDNLDMPELIEVDVEVELPPDIKEVYRMLQRQLILDLSQMGDGEDTTRFELSSAAAKYVMCRQLANGGIYGPKDHLGFEPRPMGELKAAEKQVYNVHRAKSDAVKEIHDELMGKPLLVAITFRHDHDRLCESFGYKIPVIWGGTTRAETDRLVDDWNAGKIPVLAAHPAAMAHGLNMQSGPCCDIAWMGVPDVPEYYIQTNARLWRQGQRNNVRVHRIICPGTVDEAALQRLLDKDAVQKSLLEALKDTAFMVAQLSGLGGGSKSGNIFMRGSAV